MFVGVHEIPWFMWLIIPPILLVQGTWLFLDARERDSFPWFWGIWGMISFPLPIILYFIFVRKVFSGNQDNGGRD